MSSQTNEEALESCIEQSLLAQAFYKGENKDFNKEYAIDEKIEPLAYSCKQPII